MRRLATVLASCLLAASMAHAELAPVQIDGFFDDWASLTVDFTDGAGDDGSSGIDLGGLWLANDQDWFYMRYETGADIQPDDYNDLTMYLDTDMNAGTGVSINGIGADLVWNLGDRSGTFYRGGTSSIYHQDIGLRIGPTVSSTQFEVALSRDAVPANGQALFPGSQLRMVLSDASGGDRLPDSGSVTYTFAAGTEPIATLDLGRADPGHLRLASWNVQGDGLFDGGSTEDAQGRMLDVMDPDVLVVNEVWNHNANDVRNVIEQHLPSGTGEDWYATGSDGGNVLVSRLPILGSWEVNPGYRITAALLDLGASQTLDLLVIACHWRCCTADADRQNEADSIIEFLADARSPGGRITLPEGTPFILAGDLNLVGWARQLETILTGDILDEGAYGPDSAPDWDGGPFTPVVSRQADARMAYTWRNDYSSYYPGVLDWVLYTDSALQLQNHYVLETRTMLTATLSANGLQYWDSTNASDHAPRVADFILASDLSAVPGVGPATAQWARLLPNAPNPFNPTTELRFALDRDADVALAVFDVRGRLVHRFAPRAYPAGVFGTTWDGRDGSGRTVASGVYQVRMTSRAGGDETTATRSVTLVE